MFSLVESGDTQTEAENILTLDTQVQVAYFGATSYVVNLKSSLQDNSIHAKALNTDGIVNVSVR